MKIIYDISRLGECYFQPQARTGVFRVIENIAEGLIAAPECELSFSATESFEALNGAILYLNEQTRFGRVPFLFPGDWQRKQRLARRLRDINADLAGSSFSEVVTGS